MNEPQVWTMIGLFGAIFFAVLGVVSGLFTQVLRAEIGKVVIGVDALGNRLDGLDKRMDRLEARFDGLDRDVQAIARRVFPEPE